MDTVLTLVPYIAKCVHVTLCILQVQTHPKSIRTLTLHFIHISCHIFSEYHEVVQLCCQYWSNISKMHRNRSGCFFEPFEEKSQMLSVLRSSLTNKCTIY